MRMGWQLYRSGEPCRGHASRQCGVQALSEGPPDSSRSRPAHVSCAQQHTRTPPSTTCTHQHRHAWQADIEPLLVAADWANATDSADGPSTALDCCCCCPGFTPALRLVTVQVALGALRHGHVCIGLSSAGGGRVQQRWRLIAAARRCRRCVRCCAACCAGLPCPRAGGWQRLRHRVPQARVGDAGRGVGRGLPLAPLPPAAHTCGWCGLEHNTGESGGVGACSALARTRSDARTTWCAPDSRGHPAPRRWRSRRRRHPPGTARASRCNPRQQSAARGRARATRVGALSGKCQPRTVVGGHRDVCVRCSTHTCE